jgi:CheY-like chemotaxis protein
MITRKPAILVVVDDDRMIRESLAAALFDAGYTVRLAIDGVSALGELRDFEPDVLLSDLDMPGMGGCELLSIVRRRFPAIRSVAMSGAYWSNEVPPGIAADAFYAKGSHPPSRLFEILAALAWPGHASSIQHESC